MRIAMVSDIHDNIWALAEVLERVKDCDALLCLGDMCSPFTLAAMAAGFGGPVHVVWGNNDGDRLLLVRVATQAGNVNLHGEFAQLEFGVRRVAMIHYPEIARPLAMSGQYDMVCYGHNHQREITQQGDCLQVNPGEVMGRFGVTSCAVYDTDAHEATLIEIPRARS